MYTYTYACIYIYIYKHMLCICTTSCFTCCIYLAIDVAYNSSLVMF